MEVSKITLSPDMLDAINKPGISNKKREQLRIQRVKEYINSKPSGEYITKGKLSEVAGYGETSRAAGYLFIDKITKKGVINCFKESKFKMSWSTNDGIKVKKKAIEHAVDEDEPKKKSPLKENLLADLPVDPRIGLNIYELERKARQFAWDNNSDSLREFINYMIVNRGR